MSIEKRIKEGSAKVNVRLTEVMEAHEELVTELEGEIETLESDNDELKSHVESLTEMMLEAKNELLEIEEKGLSI
jgi:chromosome segregation ATPase